MIDRLILKNFKVLRDVDVRLRPLTLIVGPNSSGKSSLLQALGVMAKVATADRSVLAPAGLRSRISNEGPILSCYFDKQEVIVTISPSSPFWEVRVRPYEGGKRGGEEDEEFDDQDFPHAMSLFIGVVELDLQVEKLAAPSYPKQILASLPPDGEGLSAFLASMHLERPLVFRSLVERLRSVVPVVRDIRLKSTYLEEAKIHKDVERKVGYELLFDTQGAEGISAQSISEGTLLTLGLLTALSAFEPPRLLLIDELERGLHPKALGDLVRQIRSIQEQYSELQIVATSHSPYLLDYLEAEEILLSSLDEEGYASVRPLSEHPEYERWKGIMAPGEFWSTVGEKWVTETAGS